MLSFVHSSIRKRMPVQLPNVQPHASYDAVLSILLHFQKTCKTAFFRCKQPRREIDELAQKNYAYMRTHQTWRFLPLAVAIITIILASCYEDNSCFDKGLYEKHKDDTCPENCTGFAGCDGIFYCNECVANRVGIRSARD